MQLNAKQIISIVGAVLSVLMISTAQLTDLFGPGVAKTIVSVSGLFNTVLSSVMAVITSNTQTAKDASGIKGVDLNISRDAPQAIAALAMDPAQDSIAPAPGEGAAVRKVAEGAAA